MDSQGLMSLTCVLARRDTSTRSNALRVHLDDLEAQTEVFEAFGDPGDMSELGHHQPGQGVEISLRSLVQVEQFAELVEREPAVEQPRAVRALDEPRLFLAIGLGQAAQNRLEDVVEGHDADHGAVLIEHHGGVSRRLLQDLEDLRPPRSLVDESGQA